MSRSSQLFREICLPSLCTWEHQPIIISIILLYALWTSTFSCSSQIFLELLTKNQKTPVKSVKGEQDIDKLQIKIEELQKQLDKYKQENEELQKKSEDLQKEIDRRKAQFKLGWRESTLYPDWRKEEFQAVNVTLDEATAHPSLLLTEEGRGVTLQEIQQDLPSSTQRFVSIPCVLGQLQICVGRYYWEVEVGDLHSWDLGVCRDNVSRKGTFQMSPQNGFWAIRPYQEDYWALTISETHLTLREKPLSVGIFLDYEAGDVSFYNMTDESHIFTFSNRHFMVS
ncbi:butyrophilin subfamily 1 member A1-like [Dama dama]